MICANKSALSVHFSAIFSEKGGIIGVHLLKNCPHERLAYESRPIGHGVALAVAREGALLRIVEQDGHLIGARSFPSICRSGSHQNCRPKRRPSVTKLRPTQLV